MTDHAVPTRRVAILAALATVGASSAVARQLHAAIHAGAPPDALDAARSTDWDFFTGHWTAVHRRLKARLVGSTDWEEFAGTSECWSLLDGAGSVADNTFDRGTGMTRGVGINARDPRTGEWLSWWLDGQDAANIGTPMHGRFTNGVGVFLADDTFNGQPIKVRVTWTPLSHDRVHWEQAFSPDGGITWEPNVTGDFTRSAEPTSDGTPTAWTGHEHDWDWLVGRWNVQHRRLKERLMHDTHWEEFSGTSELWPTLGGRGTLDDNMLDLPAGAYRAMGIRAFDRATGQWSIWWLDARSALLDPPVRGEFGDSVGTFIGDGTLRGAPIKVRFQWSQVTATTAHWEQSFSPDGGATWELNWTMDFRRAR